MEIGPLSPSPPWGEGWGEGYQALYEHGIDAAFALASGPMTLEQACAEAPRLLRERASDVARVWRVALRKA